MRKWRISTRLLCVDQSSPVFLKSRMFCSSTPTPSKCQLPVWMQIIISVSRHTKGTLLPDRKELSSWRGTVWHALDRKHERCRFVFSNSHSVHTRPLDNYRGMTKSTSDQWYPQLRILIVVVHTHRTGCRSGLIRCQLPEAGDMREYSSLNGIASSMLCIHRDSLLDWSPVEGRQTRMR